MKFRKKPDEMAVLDNILFRFWRMGWLKEQEAEIEQLNRFVNGFSRDAMPVVRCKDCEHGEKVNSVYLCGKSRRFGVAHEPDWVCADGRRRDEEKRD